MIANVAGDLLVPLINKKAIKAEYRSANARQLQSVYNYQRVILNAFTEVINRLSKVENYRKSIEIKKQQVESLEASVEAASRLFQSARADYVDVLFAQRDLNDARTVLVETKQQQLSAIVNTYQALGGGWEYLSRKDPAVPASPHVAAAARAPAMPATAPNDLANNDLANPDPQPGDPRTSQSGSATDLPPALP